MGCVFFLPHLICLENHPILSVWRYHLSREIMPSLTGLFRRLQAHLSIEGEKKAMLHEHLQKCHRRKRCLLPLDGYYWTLAHESCSSSMWILPFIQCLDCGTLEGTFLSQENANALQTVSTGRLGAPWFWVSTVPHFFVCWWQSSILMQMFFCLVFGQTGD